MAVFLLPFFRRRNLQEKYLVENWKDRPSSQIIFTYDPDLRESVCLKILKPVKDDLRNYQDLKDRQNYIIQGLYCNRLFSPHIYLGIAPIRDYQLPHADCRDVGVTKKNGAYFIYYDSIIAEPPWEISDGREYALVMKKLNEQARLDRLLQAKRFISQRAMSFLAHKIVDMHAKLKNAPANKGNVDVIEKKCELNTKKFKEAIDKFICNQNCFDKDKNTPAFCRRCQYYQSVASTLREGFNRYKPLFFDRYQHRHIKYCHGDLKASNLWVPSRSSWLSFSRQSLLMLDRVDFNDDFCYIDTLSDIAMLAIDIEAFLIHILGNLEPHGESLVQHFIDTYLDARQENFAEIGPLLEYYLLEKAMIRAYMGILYPSENEFDMNNSYLSVAYRHAQRLQQWFHA